MSIYDEACVLVIGQNVWGKGETIEEALKEATNPKSYDIYFAEKTTKVTSLGDIEYKEGCPPKFIASIRNGRISATKQAPP